MAELKQLQVKLKELDQKAGLIELDLRNAMDQGKIFLTCKDEINHILKCRFINRKSLYLWLECSV